MFGGYFELAGFHWQVERFGEMALATQKGMFTQHPVSGLLAILFHQAQGFFFLNPIVFIFVILGLIDTFKKHNLIYLFILTLYLSFLIFYSFYKGSVFNPDRYFMAPICLSTLVIASYLKIIFKNLDKD